MIIKDDLIQTLTQSVLHSCKFKKLDLYSIFRFLTAKQAKRQNIDYSSFKTPELKPEEEKSLQAFISQVNPYFDKLDNAKYEYYIKNYYLAKMISEKCCKYFEEKNIIKSYRIKQKNGKNQSYMTFYELDDIRGHKTEIATYESKERALEQVNKFLALYRFLRIEMPLELIAFNCNEEILEKEFIE